MDPIAVRRTIDELAPAWRMRVVVLCRDDVYPISVRPLSDDGVDPPRVHVEAVRRWARGRLKSGDPVASW